MAGKTKSKKQDKVDVKVIGTKADISNEVIAANAKDYEDDFKGFYNNLGIS